MGLDMLREFCLVINADSAHCYSAKLRCRIPVTVLPSGHLALALTPSGSFKTTGETKTLVEETAADMTAAVQEDFLEQGQHPIVAGDESNDGDTKQVPRVPGSVIRDLLAAARQMDETMVSAFTAACSFRRLDLALVNPGTVQTILVDDVTAAGGTAEEWSDGDLTTVRGAQKLRDWFVMKSPRIVWFCCPTENSTPSKNCHLTAAQSCSRHQSREHRIQRHMSNLAADMASSAQCDIVLEIPWNSRAVRFGGCIHERLKGFHCAWVPACAWCLRTDSIGYAEGGWRVVASMRSVADLLVSRSCNATHWHRSVEGIFPPAASLSHLCRRLMPIVLRRPAPMELAELVAGATIKRRLRSKQTIQRRLTKKQPLSGNGLPQSSDPATETVPDVEEHPILPDRTEPSKVEEHPVVPERTEPWRPLTETEKNAWNTLSPEEREVCDALVHRLHRELGHSDIRGMVDSLRQNRAHPTVLAAAKLMHCTACQESARMLSRPVTSGTVMEPGAVLQMDNFYWKHLKEVHVKGLFKSGCGSDLANCTPSGTSWKCVSVGSKTNATRVVVQVLRTSRNSHDRP